MSTSIDLPLIIRKSGAIEFAKLHDELHEGDRIVVIRGIATFTVPQGMTWKIDEMQLHAAL